MNRLVVTVLAAHYRRIGSDKECDVSFEVESGGKQYKVVYLVQIGGKIIFVCHKQRLCVSATVSHCVLPQITQLHQPVSVEERVAVTVWKLATNIEYRTLASLFGLGRPTVGKIVVETSHAISTHLLPQCQNPSW